MASVYAIGSNGSGQLGIGHKEDVSVPKLSIFKQTPQDIACIHAGGNHTLLLTNTGLLYCAGDYSAGACGLSKETALIFSEYNSSEDPMGKIVFCAATWEASVLVRHDAAGRATNVYTLGTGQKGELGLGELIFRSVKAQLIPNFPPSGTAIVDLGASVGHIVAVLDNGEVYGWGNGRKGQLGLPAEIVYEPRKIDGLNFKVISAVCGREHTAFFGCPENGEYIVCGSDKASILSAGPELAKGWRSVGSSWGSVYILLHDGSVVSWGRNDHGQLAPENLPKLDQLAVGSEHAIGLTRDGDVLAWGWGEHGNCGPVKGSEVDIKGKWNTIASSRYLPPNSKIVSIGAGCATSWICIS